MLFVAVFLAFLVAAGTARSHVGDTNGESIDENGLSPEFRNWLEKNTDLWAGKEADIKMDGISMRPERIFIKRDNPSRWDTLFGIR